MPILKDHPFIEKAAQHALSEVIGHEESQAYYFLLTKQDSKLDDHFSYSKKYRLMKNLFNIGIICKIKVDEKDLYHYYPLPPSFLCFREIDEEIITHLEQIYLKNYSDLLKTSFSQIILKDEKSLVIFLVKYVMKESAKLLLNDQYVKEFVNYANKDVSFYSDENNRRKMGIIDNKVGFEFSMVENGNGYDYVGYITSRDSSKGALRKDYLQNLETEFRKHE